MQGQGQQRKAQVGATGGGQPDASRRLVHQRELVVQSRCAHCAEPVARLTLLRGEACPHCERPSAMGPSGPGSGVLEQLVARWRRRRWVVYSVLATAGLLAGLVPLLAAPVRLVGLIGLHVVLLRRALRWLSLPRRVLTRLTLKLLLAVLAVLGLVLDVLAAPLLGGAAPIAALVSLLASVAYAETALGFVRSRLTREAAGDRLAWWEWGLPAALLLAMALVSAGLVGALWLASHVVTEVAVPAVSDLTRWLL